MGCDKRGDKEAEWKAKGDSIDDLTIAVNKITCQSAIVNKKGEDVTEKYRALFREILEEDFLD